MRPARLLKGPGPIHIGAYWKSIYCWRDIDVMVCVGDGGTASFYMKLNDVDAGAWQCLKAFAKMRILSGP
jgi:hypothetical protein